MRCTSLRGLVAATLTVCLVACGGGSGGGSGTPADPGEVTVAVTDAPTDELDLFEIDIVAFRFEKANGAVVEVLPQRTRVDFAQLVSVSEVIAAATIPVGTYTSASMTLDFSSAQVRLQGSATPAQLLDGSGRPLSGQQAISILFPGGGFVVGARRGHFALVDFDLDQSLVVDSAANTVQLDSVFYASIDPANPTPTRVPGLASGFSGAEFELDVRVGLGLVSRGTVTVTTTSATLFSLDGQVLSGQAGLDALAARGDGTLVVARGSLDPQTRRHAATQVVLLPQNLDEVGGIVVARSGGGGADAVLTLRGVAVRRGPGGSLTFNDTVTLRTSFAETRVARRGQGGTLNPDAINVGQRILAYGNFNGSTLDLTQPGAGFVRLIETDLNGAVVGTPGGGQLTLDVARVGRRLAGGIDWSVEGVAQADPDALVVDTAGLGLAAIGSGTPVHVRGFVAPVTSDAAATPDFDADTVIDRSQAGSLLRVGWIPANPTPFVPGSGALTVDVASAAFARVDYGLVAPVDLQSNVTLAGSTGFYAVVRGFRLQLFTSFAAFRAQLDQELTGGAQLRALRAFGRYDAAATSFTATRSVALLR